MSKTFQSKKPLSAKKLFCVKQKNKERGGRGAAIRAALQGLAFSDDLGRPQV